MKKTPIDHPPKAVMWSITSHENKIRLSATNEVGLGVREWPIDECTVETIRERWGSGAYQIMWYGKKGGVKHPMGTSGVFDVADDAPRAQSAPARETPPAPHVPQGPPSPQEAFIQSLQVSSVMQQNAMNTFGSVFKMVGDMLSGVMSSRQSAETGQRDQQLLMVLQQQGAAIAAIQARLDAEEEEEEEEEEGEPTEIIKDGSLNTDALYNKGLSMIPDMLGAATNLANAVATEKRSKIAAQSPAPSPIPNATEQSNQASSPQVT